MPKRKRTTSGAVLAATRSGNRSEFSLAPVVFKLLDASELLDYKDLTRLVVVDSVARRALFGARITITNGHVVPDIVNLTALRLRAIETRWRVVGAVFNGLCELTALQCSQLRSINLRGCTSICDITALGQCTRLQEIDLNGCTGLLNVAALGHCSSLHTLLLQECSGLENVAGLGKLEKLHTLNLSRCRSLSDISALRQCCGLHSIDVTWCNELTNLTALEQCGSLLYIRRQEWRGGSSIILHTSRYGEVMMMRTEALN
jgi:hypothetical protein